MTLKEFVKKAEVYTESYNGDGDYRIGYIDLDPVYKDIKNCVVKDTDTFDLKYLHDNEDGLWVFTRDEPDNDKVWVAFKIR